MTTTDTTPRPHIVGPRPCAVYGPPPKTKPRPTRLGWAVLAVLVVAGTTVLSARASEDEDVPRYVPTSRGVLRGWHADLIVEHFPPGQVATALRVMACESKGDPDATGRAGEKGLMQVHPIWQELAERLYWPGVSLYEPSVNVHVAAVIWGAMGWGAWSCAR